MVLFAIFRFEKSLYDLIRGLRNHKGVEEDYIQDSLRECKTEIKTQDMGKQLHPERSFGCLRAPDKKATALLKLIYLEMFGYDMSWASFHVLEVMSSTKYLQKRSGYLAAVQSFRPDTEVLMMATNLLKKVPSTVPRTFRGTMHSNNCTGFNVLEYPKYVPAAHNTAKHNHTFACHVFTAGRSVPDFSFARHSSKEGGGVSISPFLSLPRGP